GRQLQRLLQADALRQRRVDERVQRRHADHLQHGRQLRFVRADVPLFKSVGLVVRHEVRYFTSSAYCSAVRSESISFGLLSSTTISQVPCGSEFTVSGLVETTGFTWTTLPDTGL